MKNLLDYQPEAADHRAAWAQERMRASQKDSLQTIVPGGFQSYLRLCQPAWRWPAVDPADTQALRDIASGHYGWENATPVRWSEVAAETHRPVHRLMQWHSIAPPPVKLGQAGISQPIEYEITRDMVEALFAILIEHSGAEQECLCAFWEGYGSKTHDALRAAGNTLISGIGQQRYFLFHASLRQVRDQWAAILTERFEPAGFAPNAVWPTSQAWYYAVPIGPTTSYLGGTAELVTAVQNSEALETYQAFPTDNIWAGPLSNR